VTALTKVNGAWRNVVAPHIKIAGSWKIAKSAWVKLNGQWKSWFLQGGLLDVPFANNIGSGPNSRTFGGSASLRIVEQPDGKLLIGGSFTVFNGVTVNHIIRLNSDGTRDTTFSSNIGTGSNTPIAQVTLQQNGKIVLIGYAFGDHFGQFNGATVPGLVRLNSDGTVDTTFLTNIGTGIGTTTSFTNSIYAVIEQPDGKLLIGGSFTVFNGVTVNRIIRLNSDGTRDTTFSSNTGSGFTNAVFNIIIQPDGKFLIRGSFTTFNGASTPGLVRLNSDGTRDTTFSSNIGSGYGTPSSASAISIQSDGKIYISGSFTQFNGATVPGLVRLNSDGTVDTTFLTNIGTGPNNAASGIEIQDYPDGKLLLSNSVMSQFNGATVPGLVRLNSDGTVDTTFLTNIYTGGGPSGSISQTKVQTNNKIIVRGGFNRFNGYVSIFLARLNSDGTLDVPFTTNLPVFNSVHDQIYLQQDGNLILTSSSTNIGGTSSNFISRHGGDEAF
jgi:uncharacterized delta-60 repeat protein